MQRDLPEMLRDYCSSSCDSNFEPKVGADNCPSNNRLQTSEVAYMSSRLSTGAHCQANSSVVLSSKSAALTEPTREAVSCVVRSKERLLGYAHLKNEIYVEYVCADGTSYKPGGNYETQAAYIFYGKKLQFKYSYTYNVFQKGD